MTIERVGKGASGVESVLGGVVTEVDALPQVSGTAIDSASLTGVQRSEALGRLERGEIGLKDYLDTQVEAATRHLASTLSSEQLAFVTAELRRQLASEPMLIELVRTLTGKVPEAPEEG